jgi:hypothetical protein
MLYTVTKANQNEALLWKISVLVMEKAPRVFKSPRLCRKILSLAHIGILHSSMLEISCGMEGLLLHFAFYHTR